MVDPAVDPTVPQGLAHANGDHNGAAENDCPAAKPKATRKKLGPKKKSNKRRRKKRSDPNPQDPHYGPSFKPELIFQKLIFAIAFTTYYFSHSWQKDKSKPLRVVYISPLSLLFCKYCGVVFRTPETLHAHYNKEVFVPSQVGPEERLEDGKEDESDKETPPSDFCSRVHVPVIRSVNPQPEHKNTLQLYKIDEEDKWAIHEIAGQAVIDYERATTIQPPLGLSHYLRPEEGKTLPTDPTKRKLVTRRGRLDIPNKRKLKLFQKKFPDQRRNPNVLWDSDPTHFGGRAPFMLVSTSIRVTKMEKWIERKFGRGFNKVWLVACDECTTFGCMGCGLLGDVQKVTDCMFKCFDYEEGELTGDDEGKKVHSKVQYNQDKKGYSPSRLKCRFAEELNLAELSGYVKQTGKQNATKLAPPRGRIGASGVRDEPTEEELSKTHFYYVDLEHPKHPPAAATAATTTGQGTAQQASLEGTGTEASTSETSTANES